MPYINPAKRQRIALGHGKLLFPGELNYAFTRLAKSYIEENGLNYQTINDILGALEGAKQEFYRRIVAPYENTKIAENGDVY